MFYLFYIKLKNVYIRPPFGGGGRVSQLNIKAFKHGCSETFDICGPENMHVYTCMCMYEYCF